MLQLLFLSCVHKNKSAASFCIRGFFFALDTCTAMGAMVIPRELSWEIIGSGSEVCGNTAVMWITITAEMLANNLIMHS